MRTLTLALALLVPGCATGGYATLGPEVPDVVRTAIERGPVFESELHARASVYRIPVDHLESERDAVWHALLAAPVVRPGFVDVGVEFHDRVRVRPRAEILRFDSPQLSVARTGGGYHLGLVDPDDESHHYLVEFEPTPGLDAAWDELARSAGVAAAAPPEPDRRTKYVLIDDSAPNAGRDAYSQTR